MIRNIILACMLLVADGSPVLGEDPIQTTSNKVPLCSTTTTVTQSASFSQEFSTFFSSLLDTSQFPARWYCGDWSQFHGWLYIGSDLAIWLAYFMIPMVMGYFLIQKKEALPFKGIFTLFIAFILACGLTHLIDAAIFWWPAYKLSALLRFCTALVSLGTVVALIRIIPQVTTLKSQDELLKEVEHRKMAEQQLAKKVAELTEINELMVNRELRMAELKAEINRLKGNV